MTWTKPEFLRVRCGIKHIHDFEHTCIRSLLSKLQHVHERCRSDYCVAVAVTPVLAGPTRPNPLVPIRTPLILRTDTNPRQPPIATASQEKTASSAAKTPPSAITSPMNLPRHFPRSQVATRSTSTSAVHGPIVPISCAH